jgi:hypothetical protein
MAENRIKFNNQETRMILSAIQEYIDIMLDGEETHDYTRYMLDNGLGSALRKLTKGRNGNCLFEKYHFHRESYHYPSFEEWKSAGGSDGRE